MLRAVVGVCCLLAILPAPAFAEPSGPIDPVGPRVRGATPKMERLIQTGIQRSATFAALISSLNKTDVIVYVQETRDLPPGVDGQLAITTGRSPQRYLRAQVLAGLGTTEMIAVIAHELQHAIEVAEHHEVRDSHSLANLYRRIGLEPDRGRYDTQAAQLAGKQVRNELS